jgi:hypothetical protein
MLQGIEYVPLLYTKRAEIRALENLDSSTRAKFFPILCVRPWPNAHQFTAIEPYLESATAGFRHGIDLDKDKRGHVNVQPCAAEFSALFDAQNGFSNFYDFVGSHADRVPVLRDSQGNFAQLDEQFDHIDELHRGVIIRVLRGNTVSIEPVLSSGRLIPDDTLFVVDVGWSLDVLQQEAWVSNVISQITDWDPTVEIVVMSSSFPNSFTHIEYAGSFSNDDRELFGRLVQQHNIARLIYGDWASTRLSEEQGGGTHYDRIDTASLGEWTSYRQTGDESGYKVIADRILADQRWQSLADCWGKHRIECTSLDIPNRIVGTESAIATRINMHITAQANQGDVPTVPDEPYIDTV